jgi:hypothetical protein
MGKKKNLNAGVFDSLHFTRQVDLMMDKGWPPRFSRVYFCEVSLGIADVNFHLPWDSIPPDDVDEISRKLRSEIVDDALVERAVILNWETTKSRLDREIIGCRIIENYQSIFNSAC